MARRKVTAYVLEFEDEHGDVQDVWHFKSKREAKQALEEKNQWYGQISFARVTYTTVLDQNGNVIDEFGREYTYYDPH